MATHLDGARVFNAAVASGLSLDALCKPFDTVSICFSKGLGAPVESVLVGSKALMAIALRWRKMLGGGMRQSGVLEAACLYALDHHVDRLAQGHEHACQLAAGLHDNDIKGVSVLSHSTNMVFVEFADDRAQGVSSALAQQGLLINAVYGGPTRLVTHLDVSAENMARACQAIKVYFSS